MAALQAKMCNFDISSLDASLIKAAYCPTKLFIGGLSKKTTSKTLREYFSKFGRVLDCVAMSKGDGSARSFGFVTLNSVDAAQTCLAQAHLLDGHVLDIKPTEGKSKLKADGNTAAAPQTQKRVELATPAKLRAPPGLAGVVPTGVRAPPGLPEPEPLPEKNLQQLCEQVDSDASSTAPPSSASVRDDSDEEETATQDLQEESVATIPALPSVGSGLHETGGCKPCSFFAKGTCGSGPACGFCHFAHEKKRPTRQEKRERHDRWLQKMQKPAVDEDSEFNRRWTRSTMLGIFAAMKKGRSPA